MSPTFPQKVIRFCPKCGDDKFAFQEDNSFLCKKCNFHLYINSAAAVAALIVNEKGELLLTRRAVEPHKGMLDLPGGFVDVMETAEQTLCREIKEELNLELDHFTYFMSFPNEYVFGGISVFTIDLAYMCKVDSFNGIQAADDIAEYCFCKFSDIRLDDICSKSIRRIVESYIGVQNKLL